LLVAAGAFWLIARWPMAVRAAGYELGPISIPRIDFDLVLAGFGLGLIIAPLASAALRSSAPEQHGVVSASVVVARMMGMLIGIAALGAAGVYRFQQLTKGLAPPLPFEVSPEVFERQLRTYEEAVRAALHTEYGELFGITAVVCLVGAMVALGLGRRAEDSG
jgi:hypothetical protein